MPARFAPLAILDLFDANRGQFFGHVEMAETML